MCIRLHKISKRFGTTTALNDVSFSVREGEIHAILGENGAGKSTLAKILVGLLQPNQGRVEFRGKTVSFNGTRDARNHGIGMVFQTPSLIQSLTVKENLALVEGSKAPCSWNPMTRRTSSSNEGLRNKSPAKCGQDRASKDSESSMNDLQVDSEAVVGDLSMGERQQVEVFRLLRLGVDVLILDEPNSSLSHQESLSFLDRLVQLRDTGKTIILITHRLPDVMEIADRVSVLRQGNYQGTWAAANINPRMLSLLTVDHLPDAVMRGNTPSRIGTPVLSVENLTVVNLRSESNSLEGLSFRVFEGEIFGVAGVLGNGQKELTEVLTGRREFVEGRIRLKGQEYSYSTMVGKIAYVPEDSTEEGVAENLPVLSNLMLDDFRSVPYSSHGWLAKPKLHAEAVARARRFGVRPNRVDASTRSLSGGNLRRLVLARELSGEPELIIALNPTAGLDIASASQIRTHIAEMAKGGCGVLIISADLDELVALSDRIMILYRGESTGILDRGSFDAEAIGLLMSGIGRQNGNDSSMGEAYSASLL